MNRLSIQSVPEASIRQTSVLYSSESFFHCGVTAFRLMPLSCAQSYIALSICSCARDELF